MDRAFRIIQLSDCHVSADPAALYRGTNARQALERVLEAARCWEPDLVLVSGDLSEDYSEASYEYIARALGAIGVPVVTTPGNHDRPDLQLRYFPDTAISEPLIFAAGAWRVVILNSSVENEVPGRLKDAMLDGLRRALGDSSRPVLVVLHHQPVAVGSHWIDRYPLLEPGPFMELLESRREVRGVVWGHIHHAFREQRFGALLLGAPSTVSNSVAFREEFTPDPAGPACRWLKLAPDGSLASGILRSGAGLIPPAAPARG